MRIFFIADTHFGHKNSIKYGSRPFASVEKMNEALIENWNQAVLPEDVIYILGDFAYCSKTPAEDFLKRLNGEKHLIPGNHERGYFSAVRGQELSSYWIYEGSYKERTIDGHKVILCHYPLMSWVGQKRGSLMIHGHIHNRKNEPYTALWSQLPNLLNAGVDINGYKPVTLDELIENNTKFKQYLHSRESGEKSGCPASLKGENP